MKKIYIDCGGNLGQGYDQITEKFSDIDFDQVHIFEPNPETCKFLSNKEYKHDDVKIYQKAAYDKNVTKMLTVEFDPTEGVQDWVGGATNILEDNFVKPHYIDDKYIKPNDVQVDCMDFSKWLSDNFSADDFIVLKLDCEGCEYEILDKMILEKTIEYVDQIIVEWHNHMRNDPVKPIGYYLEKFKQYDIGYTQWY